MDVKILKRNKLLTVPYSSIVWKISKHHLHLTLVINTKLYEESGYELPPSEIGRCIDWRDVNGYVEGTTQYSAAWDLKRVVWDALQDVTIALLSFSFVDDTHKT